MTLLAIVAIAVLLSLAMWLDDRAAQVCFCGAPKVRSQRFCAACEAEVPEWLA